MSETNKQLQADNEPTATRTAWVPCEHNDDDICVWCNLSFVMEKGEGLCQQCYREIAGL